MTALAKSRPDLQLKLKLAYEKVLAAIGEPPEYGSEVHVKRIKEAIASLGVTDGSGCRRLPAAVKARIVCSAIAAKLMGHDNSEEGLFHPDGDLIFDAVIAFMEEYLQRRDGGYGHMPDWMADDYELS